MEYKVTFYYLERVLILTGTILDFFYSLVVYQIEVNDTFSWIHYLQFSNMPEEIIKMIKNTHYRRYFYEEVGF